MAAILKKLWISYDLVTEKLPDPRTKSWPLVAKPHEGLLIIAIYTLFVLKWGPNWMKNRPAFNVDKLMIVYNIIQVIASAYIFYEFLVYAWAWDYQWVCEPIDYSDTPKAMNVARAVYHYYLIKYLDLTDTIFFVLRKKFNQVSFLHVHHHVNMIVVSWGAITYFPGGHCTLIGLINSFVHVIMYGYYLLTVIDPSAKKSLRLKKHITQLQILQMTVICIHICTLLVVPDCKYPSWHAIVVVPSELFMLCLFVDFYIQTYVRGKCVTEKQESIASETENDSCVKNGESSSLRRR